MKNNLHNKKILLGVSGGIAAYKSAFLVRLLVKAGAEVRVVMTPAAQEFIGPITLATLSKNPVLSEFTSDEGLAWNNHVELALWADVVVIAPATSNTLAKMATGLCDNLLMAVYLSAKSPVFVAPAMDLDMAEHPSLLRNVQTLTSDGVHIIPYNTGELASGLTGPGRMAEPEEIVHVLENHFGSDGGFTGKRVLINAGPTYEALDPVRFIGNRSTGKMGVALANELANQGATVQLVLGPTSIPHVLHPSIDRIDVESAADMLDACVSRFAEADVAILTAAVSDFTPEIKSDQKIKKTANTLEVQLVKTADILSKLGESKRSDQYLVGFALETNNELEYAKQKLQRKNLDMVVLNSLNDKGAGFGHDTNKVTILHKSGEVIIFDLKDKKEVAKDIINKIADKFTHA